MNILLIRPPAVSFKESPSLIISEPLGLMYLASYLKVHGEEPVIIDGFLGNKKFRRGDFFGYGLSYDELAEKIRKISPEIVGISCDFTHYSKGAHDVAEIVRNISNKILVVLGGIHASVCYENILKDQNIDIVVKGEGEETFLEIVQRYKDGYGLEGIKGTIVKVDNRIHINPDRPFIEELDILPFPSRDLLDMSDYYNQDYIARRGMQYPRLSMVTSRGCPFNCVFCSIHCVWKHSYRIRSSKNVVDEISFLCKDYGVKEIIFYDDNMTLNKKRINEICDEIIKRKIRIRWSMPNGVAIWSLDNPTITNMKRAGCYKITVGLESGSPATLKFIGKENLINFKKVKDTIKFCNRIGLWTMSSFIIGFPFETKEDIYKTLSFAIDCDVDMASFFCAQPYPGTGLFEICKKEGLLPISGEDGHLNWIGLSGRARFNTRYFKKEEIDVLASRLKKNFLRKRAVSFLNPQRLLRKLKGLDEIKYFLKMLRSYLPLLKDSFR